MYFYKVTSFKEPSRIGRIIFVHNLLIALFQMCFYYFIFLLCAVNKTHLPEIVHAVLIFLQSKFKSPKTNLHIHSDCIREGPPEKNGSQCCNHLITACTLTNVIQMFKKWFRNSQMTVDSIMHNSNKPRGSSDWQYSTAVLFKSYSIEHPSCTRLCTPWSWGW